MSFCHQLSIFRVFSRENTPKKQPKSQNGILAPGGLEDQFPTFFAGQSHGKSPIFEHPLTGKTVNPDFCG